MRSIPGLNSEIVNRATALANKSRDARAAVPSTAAPTASISPARLVAGTATLRLYDYIDGDGGYWGISADEVAQALDDVDGTIERIELRVNSGGGAVWDGLAIMNTLGSQGVPVTAYVDGIAASAASFITVACDEVVMMPSSRLMIHDALGICIGQASDMHAYGDFLSDSSDNIAAIYQSKAGGTVEEWRERMVARGLLGQWYSAQEAVDVGLADRLGGQSNDDDSGDSGSGSEDDRAPGKAATSGRPAGDVAARLDQRRRERHDQRAALRG